MNMGFKQIQTLKMTLFINLQLIRYWKGTKERQLTRDKTESE